MIKTNILTILIITWDLRLICVPKNDHGWQSDHLRAHLKTSSLQNIQQFKILRIQQLETRIKISYSNNIADSTGLCWIAVNKNTDQQKINGLFSWRGFTNLSGTNCSLLSWASLWHYIVSLLYKVKEEAVDSRSGMYVQSIQRALPKSSSTQNRDLCLTIKQYEREKRSIIARRISRGFKTTGCEEGSVSTGWQHGGGYTDASIV
jgi:hypothetical protein